MANSDNPFSIIHEFLEDKGEESPSCFELFSTEEGILFGSQLYELNTFVMKGSLFSIPFAEFTDRMQKMIASGEYRAMIPPGQLGEEGERIFDCLEMFLGIENEEEETSDKSLASLFGKEEVPRLLATLTFSAFTYLENYSRSIVKRLAQNESLSAQIVEQIKIRHSQIPERNRPKEVNRIDDLLESGLERRLKNLVIGLNLEEILVDEFGEKYLFYRDLFEYFVKLRNKLAHTDPAPPYEDYQHDFFQGKLAEVRKEFSVVTEDLDISPFKKLQEPIEQWIEEMAEPFTLIMAVGEMASVFPAMIDVYIASTIFL